MSHCCLCLSRAWERVFGKTEMRVLFVGLDSAGKTTTLYRLKLGRVVTTIPTIGFNVETVAYKNVSFVCWDLGGKDKIRPLWRHYYQNTSALVFVVDSNDRDRIGAARDELHRFMAEEELADAAVLVFANKQDLPNAMRGPELVESLGLDGVRQRPWHLQLASAVTGDGLYEGLDWLSKTLAGRENTAAGEVAALLSSKAKVAPEPPRTEDTAEISKAVVVHAPDGANPRAADALADRSFAVVRLDSDATAVVRRALDLASAYLRRERLAATPSDDVRVELSGDLEISEAHWPRDRSQLRLSGRAGSSAVLPPPPRRILGSQPPPERGGEHIAALLDAQAALALIAAPFFGGERAVAPAQLAEVSALDAFYYFGNDRDGELSCAAHTEGCALTLIVSDAPGLEARDARSGEWVPLSLGPGEVAVLAGHFAHVVGIDSRACEHRVWCQGRGRTRTSISLDVYVPIMLSSPSPCSATKHNG